MAQPTIGNHALLKLDRQLLALPQTDVVTVELASMAMVLGTEGTAAAGLIEYDNDEWLVFSLDEELRVTLEFPQRRRFCVCFGADEASRFALLCDEVSILNVKEDGHPELLPDFMRIGNTPVNGMLYDNSKLVLMSNYERMTSYLYSVEC